MNDFRVTRAKVLLPVLSLTPIRSIPPAILVTAEQGDKAEEIFYNQIEVREFVVLSRTKLLIRIPDSQLGQPLRDLRLVSSTVRSAKTAAMTLEISRPLAKVRGVERLVQSWLILFLSTPGSSAFYPGSGGGGSKAIGRASGKDAATDLALAVSRASEELTRLQGRQQHLPLDERLLKATLGSIQVDDRATAVSAQVQISNMLGDASQFNVG